MAHDGMAAAEEDNIDAWSTEDDDYEDETSSDDEFEDDETSSDGIGCPTEGADQVRVFDCMNEHNFTLGSFLEVVYGFMNSAHFRRLLRTWYSPPRSPNSKKSRPSGGRKILHKYISEAINEIKEDLTAIRIDSLEEQMRTRTPTLWRILEGDESQ